jgi:competence protein ComEA
LQQGKRDGVGCDTTLQPSSRRDERAPESRARSGGTKLASVRTRCGAAEAPKEVEMKAVKKVVAAGLLCGLVLTGTGRGAGAAGAAPVPGGRVDINAASADELARLPGIGASKAKAIVEYRSEEPFRKAEDLRKVKGIGDKLYERVKDQITVEPAAPAKGHGG